MLLLSRTDLYFIRCSLPFPVASFSFLSLISISTRASVSSDYNQDPIQIYRGRGLGSFSRLCKLLTFANPLPELFPINEPLPFPLEIRVLSNTFTGEFSFLFFTQNLET